MIKNREAISMSESLVYVNKEEEKGKELIGFARKFISLKEKDAEDLRKKLEELGLMKLKKEDISKIIDFIPENIEELNKIFVEMNLNEDESKKILDTIQEFR